MAIFDEKCRSTIGFRMKMTIFDDELGKNDCARWKFDWKWLFLRKMPQNDNFDLKLERFDVLEFLVWYPSDKKMGMIRNESEWIYYPS